MKTIYKYVIDVEKPYIRVPVGAKLLSIYGQREDVCAWFLVDPEATEIESRHVQVFGTGDEIPQGMDLPFAGTAHLCSGYIVLHVFMEDANLRDSEERQ